MRLLADILVNAFLLYTMYSSLQQNSLVPIMTVLLGLIMMIAYNLLSRATRVEVIKITKEENNNE